MTKKTLMKIIEEHKIPYNVFTKECYRQEIDIDSLLVFKRRCKSLDEIIDDIIITGYNIDR